jgi:hypothetical protein
MKVHDLGRARPRVTPWWLAALGGVAIGCGLGFAAARGPSGEGRELRRALDETLTALRERDEACAPVDRPTGTLVAAALDSPALRAEIGRIVRDALRDGMQPAAPPPAHVEASPEVLEALTSGQELVRGALEAKVWTEAESRDLKTIFTRVGPEQRDEILATLLPALNRGDLKPDFVGPPF